MATTKRISKSTAATLITTSGGRIFTVTFKTQSGKERVMNCRLRVHKGVKGNKPTPNIEQLGMLRVYDMQAKGFRTLTLLNVTDLKINKECYSVR